jgi:hypothetical protein
MGAAMQTSVETQITMKLTANRSYINMNF